jgi:hypothetical protein
MPDQLTHDEGVRIIARSAAGEKLPRGVPFW